MNRIQASAARRRKRRLVAEIAYSAFFAALFMALGAQMAFLPVWLSERGVSDADIGWLNALGVAVRIGGGLLLPMWAERWGRPGVALCLMGLIGAAAAFAHLWAGGLGALAVLTGALAASLAGLIPLGDAHGYAAAHRLGFSYARARSVGSAAFIAANLGVGVLAERAGVDAIVLAIAGALGCAALAASFAPTAARRRRAGAAPKKAGWSGLRLLLARWDFIVFLAAVGSIQAGHAVYYVYGSVHWAGQGYGGGAIGALWAWGVAAEIALFLTARGWVERVGPRAVLMIAAALSAARWAGMALEPGLGALLALQTLHAASFALTHLAMMAHIARAAPPGAAATAQGAASAATGVTMLIATSAAAVLYPSLGALAYLSSALFALLGLVCAAAMAASGADPQGRGRPLSLSRRPPMG